MYRIHEGDLACGTFNRADQRLTALTDQSFLLVRWATDNGSPAMTTRTDPPSGNCLTIAITDVLDVLDVLDVSDPHALITCTADALLAAYGPFDGERRARDHLAVAPTAGRNVVFSRTVALHHPDQPFLPDDEWLPVPAAVAQRARPDTTDAPATVLVLLDRHHRLFAAVGPFTRRARATAWVPSMPLPDGVQRLPIGLQPAFTTLRNA